VLDNILDRNNVDAVWSHPVVCDALSQGDEEQHIFVVLGSAVTEVGRDHDYDWAIAEPSSMRSLIQLAGRIQRHRQIAPSSANLLIPSKNFKALQGKPQAYKRPGFESETFQLESHDLTDILETEQYEFISATPRLLPRENLAPTKNLADLEHQHLAARLFGNDNIADYAALWWEKNPTWNYEIQRRTPFRKSSPEELMVMYQEDEFEELKFHVWEPTGEMVSQHHHFTQVELPLAERVSAWIDTCPVELISEQAEREDEEVGRICKRFMQMRLRAEQHWLYHSLLGVHQKNN
jgi:CRISPR-associated endonuclease/helicase Cas3